jgi:hypothetical protein
VNPSARVAQTNDRGKHTAQTAGGRPGGCIDPPRTYETGS